MAPTTSRKHASLHVLLIFPGPVHDLASYFQKRLELMSRFTHGTVLLNGKPGRLRFGTFEVISLAKEGGLLKALRDVVSHASAIANQARADGDPLQLVVTYDPLRSGLVGAWIAHWAAAPLLIQLNGDYDNPANYLDVSNRLWRLLKRKLYVFIERLVLRRAQAVKVLYADQLAPFRRETRRAQVAIVPSYVDLEPFGNLGDQREVLFVGFPFYLKGVDILIEAFRTLHSSFPDWRLKILGWFPDQTELQRAIGVTPNIEIHPPVPHQDIPQHIGRCGIFVLPSRTEAMGRVLVEAMACGKPRVGSRVGGIPTVINDGEDGFLFTPGDSADLARVLRLLMSDQSLRRRLGAAAAARARRDFSAEAHLEQLEQFYFPIVDQASRRAKRSVDADHS